MTKVKKNRITLFYIIRHIKSIVNFNIFIFTTTRKIFIDIVVKVLYNMKIKKLRSEDESDW